MAVRIAKLSILLSVGTKALRAGFDAAKTRVRSFGSSIAGAGRAVGRFITSFAGLAGLTVGIGGFVLLIRQQFQLVDALAKSSRMLGITTESLAGLQLAANITGASNEDLTKSLQRLLKSVSDASVGLSTAKRGFEQLGLSVEDMEKLTADEIFIEMAEAMQRVPNRTDKVRIAMDLLGRSGIKLLNTMEGGRAALEAFKKEAQDLGLAVSAEDAARIEEANDAILRMKIAFGAIARVIAVDLAPLIVVMTEQMKEFAKSGRDGASGIASGFTGIGLGLAVILDGIRLMRLALIAVSASFTLAIQLGAEALAFFARQIDALGARLGFAPTGIEQGVNQFIDELKNEVAELDTLFFEVWDQEFNTTKFLSAMDELKNGAKSIGDEFAGAFDDLETLQAGQRLTPAALEKGTAAAFSAANRAGQNKVSEIAANTKQAAESLGFIERILQQERESTLQAAPL